MQRTTGLTLIELLATLAIVALIFGFALPGLNGAMEAGRAHGAASALLESYVAATWKSAITGQRTVLCPAAGDACLDSADWSGGWIVFVDRDGDRERQADEKIVQRHPALAGKVRLRSTAGRKRIVFQANGVNAGSNVTFTLCDGRGPTRAKTLVLSNAGRMRYGTPSTKALAATCVR